MKIIFFIFIPFLNSFSYALTSKNYPIVYDSYLLEKKGLMSRAIAKMTSLYKTNPEDYFVNFRMGELFIKDLKYNIAIDHFKRASRINQAAVSPWIEISSIFFEQKNWALLESSTEEIIKRDELNLFGHLKSIHALIELAKYSKALERIGEILIVYPLQKEILELKALAHQKNGENDLSRQALMELILIDPENVMAKKILEDTKAP